MLLTQDHVHLIKDEILKQFRLCIKIRASFSAKSHATFIFGQSKQFIILRSSQVISALSGTLQISVILEFVFNSLALIFIY